MQTLNYGHHRHHCSAEPSNAFRLLNFQANPLNPNQADPSPSSPPQVFPPLGRRLPQRLFYAVVSEEVISKVFQRVEHLLTGWHDVVAGEQEAVAPGVSEFDLVAVPRLELI